MMRIAASAPGKVVLAGEYAVLDGAPAIAMAVDRRAWTQLKSSGASTHSLKTRGYLDRRFRFTASDGRLDWVDLLPSADALSLVEAVLAECARADAESFDLSIDTSAFYEPNSGAKLGFGSSAAVAVALAAVLIHPQTNAGDRARAAHRRFQGGRGSGVDIASALGGGLIEYRREEGAAALDWPQGLEYAILWSGRPASTAGKLRKLGDRGQADAAALAPSATAAADAWRSGDPAIVLESMQLFLEQLEAFDRRSGVGVFDAGHADMVATAAGFEGVLYKPCGAGGGDVGIALSVDREALRAFTSAAAGRGFTLIKARLDPRGLQFEGPDAA